MEKIEDRGPPSARSPYEDASLFSWLTYRYVNGVLRQGFIKPLQFPDLPRIAARDFPTHVAEKVEAAWQGFHPTPRNHGNTGDFPAENAWDLWRASYNAFSVDVSKGQTF